MASPPTPGVQLTVPFPALTPGQRLHLEVHGYAVVHDVLTPAEIAWISSDLKRLRADLWAQAGRSGAQTVGSEEAVEADSPVIDHAHFAIDQAHHTYLGSLGQSRRYPGLLHYLSHPRIVGMAEELLVRHHPAPPSRPAASNEPWGPVV